MGDQQVILGAGDYELGANADGWLLRGGGEWVAGEVRKPGDLVRAGEME